MGQKPKIILTLASTVIGVFSLLLFTTIVQDILFKNISICTSSSYMLFLRGTGMLTSAIVVGFLASLIVVRDNYLPHIVICTYVIGKMSFAAFCGEFYGAFWYETLSYISLIGGIWLGFYAAAKFPLAPV